MKSLAIVSTNRWKYSETFIHSHIFKLPYNVHLLYDGYLPQKFWNVQSNHQGDITRQRKKLFYKIPFKKEHNSKSQSLHISRYLKKNKISAILAEYGPSGVEMMQIARESKIPLVVHFHGYDAWRDDVLNSYGLQYPLLFEIAERIIVVSKEMYHSFIERGCLPEKLIYLPYGIDTNIFDGVRSDNGSEDYFVSCGRFVEKKSPQNTIKAFYLAQQKVEQIKLVMIGDGLLLDNCRELVHQLKLEDKVTFTGALPQSQIADYYRKAIAFIQHSRVAEDNDREGTPLAVLEAMAMGLPIISTIHSGIPDVVTHEKHGILVKENQISKMAEAIVSLARNKDLKESMGQRAYKHVYDCYNLSGYIGSLAQIIDELAIS